MIVQLYVIAGISVGIEYHRGDEEHLPSVTVDLFVVRFIFSKGD